MDCDPIGDISLRDHAVDRLTVAAYDRGADAIFVAPASADFIANTQGAEGSFLGTTLDGVPVLNAYVRSSLSGWRIAAGLPLATLEAPLRRSYLLLASMAAAGLLASFGLAFAYSRYLTAPVAALQAGRERGGWQAGCSLRHRHQGTRCGVACARPGL